MKNTLWTVPNLLSILRLLGVPIYFLLVTNDRFEMAVALLFLAGATDYFDGKIARKFNQASRIGELLDPAADRLYILAIVLSLWDLRIIPFLLLLLLIGRDVILGLLLVRMNRRGLSPFVVTYLGKAATFNLLYAFPFLLLTLSKNELLSSTSFILGWAFSLWGVALYLYTGVAYLREGILALRALPRKRIEFS